ncbi:MAG TPA: trimeric intracellular cation channel family protein, partial [Hydrogenothermaceae bacterium]|nr:trimeric intracellular cation channel family protein [Hydrogenothermaceae bacterium]
MEISIFEIMNIIGLVAFAITGSLKAIEAKLDLLGI